MPHPPGWHLNASHPSHTRTRRRRVLIIGACATSFLALILYSSAFGTTHLTKLSSNLNRLVTSSPSAEDGASGTCSPHEYADLGQWALRPYYTRPGPLYKTNTTDPLAARFRELELAKQHVPEKMAAKEDMLKFARLEGCASSDNYWWQLATNIPEQWEKRFPHALDWEWVPGGRCGEGDAYGQKGKGLRRWDREEVIRELVEGGGWLLIGDSVTGNHYFSLSCLLYPHVVENKQTSNERDRPQHLYLNPSSPLINVLQFPEGFNIAATPLVSFRRVDLLWSPDQLVKMHKELHPEFYQNYNPEIGVFQLFGTEAVWSMELEKYLEIFFGALPEANYRTMVVSTAAHWTTNLFRGYHRTKGSDASTMFDAPSSTGKNGTVAAGHPDRDAGMEVSGALESNNQKEPLLGYDGVITFFREVMERWTRVVQDRVDEVNAAEAAASSRKYPPGRNGRWESNGLRERQVLVRAYLPGHDDCHNQLEPWTEIIPLKPWYNWGEIPRFNDIWDDMLSKAEKAGTPFKNIHYLGLARPGRLRPDGHVASDCLHIMTGAGVLEGWSHYIWHYITREIS